MRTGDQYQTKSSSWRRSLGLKGVPTLCDLLSVMVHSWATTCFQGALPQSPSLVPGELGLPHSLREPSFSHC